MFVCFRVECPVEIPGHNVTWRTMVGTNVDEPTAVSGKNAHTNFSGISIKIKEAAAQRQVAHPQMHEEYWNANR